MSSGSGLSGGGELDRFQDAAQVADRARRGAGTIRDVIEGLDRDIAAVPRSLQRREEWSEALLALSRAAAVSIIDLHMCNQAARQPVLHQCRQGLLLHAPRGAAVEHAF